MWLLIARGSLLCRVHEHLVRAAVTECDSTNTGVFRRVLLQQCLVRKRHLKYKARLQLAVRVCVIRFGAIDWVH